MSERIEINPDEYETVSRSEFSSTTECIMEFCYNQRGTVIFDKGCMESIGNPEYVMTMVSPEKGILILSKWVKIRRRNRTMPRGLKAEYNEKGEFVLNRCRLFLSRLADEMGWKPDLDTRMQFLGKKIDHDKIAFDLRDALKFIPWSAVETDDSRISNNVTVPETCHSTVVSARLGRPKTALLD